uniref:Sulfurtransferase n=1 Tax=Panagrellus redivivus TaxID=6233 RepID=A0A7E4UTK7_PANRE
MRPNKGTMDRWAQHQHHSYPMPRVIAINREPPHMNMIPNRSLRISPVSDGSYNTASTELQYSPGSYSTVQDDRFHPEYEDPENLYEKPPEVDVRKTKRIPAKTPPPLPPPLNQATLTKIPLTKPPKKIEHKCQKQRCCGVKISVCVTVLILISLLMACTVFAFLWQTQKRIDATKSKEVFESNPSAERSVLSVPLEAALPPSDVVQKPIPPLGKKPTEPLISANTLLTYIITKRRICLFEVSSLQIETSKADFRADHIEGAILLYFSNLSHSGVPVHPLQFQRYIRNLGVENDCHVILYDKGEQIWGSYAFWIFKLFGHERTSLLNGGFPEWKRLQESGVGPYATTNGPGPVVEFAGNFKAKWMNEYISAFDDVLGNFDDKKSIIVDAQSPEEFNGLVTAGVSGHIKDAINVPAEAVFNSVNNTWLDATAMEELFTEHGLHPSRPVIVYCETSLHASMVWFGLHRLRYDASVYFGSWPEWVIRAPDNLMVTNSIEAELPSSSENLRTAPPTLIRQR